MFEKLDQAKALIQEALDSFEDRKAAILHKAFSGELTRKWREENGVGVASWEIVKSDNVFQYITSGSRGWAQHYSASGAIFIRMSNLDHNTIELDFRDIQYVALPENIEGTRSRVLRNDILLSITADVGMVGYVRECEYEAYINQHVALARPIPSVCGEFVAWYLVSDFGISQLKNKQRGATKIGISLADLRELAIYLPHINEQHEIVKIINQLFDKEEHSKGLLNTLEQIEHMKKVILARAFHGELGTNDPADGNALDLLNEVISSRHP